MTTGSTAQYIAAIRKSKGMTQEELADKAAVTVRTIQRIESGESAPRDYTLKAIAAALDIDPAIFFPRAPVLTPATTETPDENTHHFLQMLNLSCFSFIAIPYIHFLVPSLLLKNHRDNKFVMRTGRRMVRYQVWWTIVLNVCMLCVVAINLAAKKLFHSSFYISYLWTALFIYLLNAIVVAAAAWQLHKENYNVYTRTFFKKLLGLRST